MKKCKVCGKNTNYFRKVKVKGKSYILSKCRKCESEYAKKWNIKNPEKFKLIQKKYFSKSNVQIAIKVRKNKFLNNFGFSYWVSTRYGINVLKKLYFKYNRHCQICNNNKDLCVHHKDGIGYSNYKKLGKTINNKLDNLLLVCRKCHMIIHDNLHKIKH